jgi:hypothetical protein
MSAVRLLSQLYLIELAAGKESLTPKIDVSSLNEIRSSTDIVWLLLRDLSCGRSTKF